MLARTAYITKELPILLKAISAEPSLSANQYHAMIDYLDTQIESMLDNLDDIADEEALEQEENAELKEAESSLSLL